MADLQPAAGKVRAWIMPKGSEILRIDAEGVKYGTADGIGDAREILSGRFESDGFVPDE